MADELLQAYAAQLRDEGRTREQATTQLLKEVALGTMSGATPSEVAEAVSQAFGGSATAGAVLNPGADAPSGTLADVEVSNPEGGAPLALRLPEWRHVAASDPPKAAPQLIDGLLRRGHVGLLVARAKSGKSWAAIALSVAVAAGREWLGFPCAGGMVAYVDPELDARSLDRRFSKVATAMGADPATVDANVLKWSLRGATVDGTRAPTVTDVAHDLGCHVDSGSIRRGDLALVVIDSCSALLAGDENASTDVRAFFNACLRIAEVTGASVLLVHHEGKARSGDRDAADRGRGSSVWTDAPDLVLSLVEVFPPSGSPSDYLQEGQRAFSLEVAAIREFPPVEPKRLIWSHPLLVPEADGITDGWKPKSTQKTAAETGADGRRAKSQERAATCVMALLAHMYRHDTDSVEGIPATQAAEICGQAIGATVKTSTLKAYVEQSEWLDVYQRSPQRWAVVPAHPRPKQLP